MVVLTVVFVVSWVHPRIILRRRTSAVVAATAAATDEAAAVTATTEAAAAAATGDVAGDAGAVGDGAEAADRGRQGGIKPFSTALPIHTESIYVYIVYKVYAMKCYKFNFLPS